MAIHCDRSCPSGVADIQENAAARRLHRLTFPCAPGPDASLVLFLHDDRPLFGDRHAGFLGNDPQDRAMAGPQADGSTLWAFRGYVAIVLLVVASSALTGTYGNQAPFGWTSISGFPVAHRGSGPQRWNSPGGTQKPCPAWPLQRYGRHAFLDLAARMALAAFPSGSAELLIALYRLQDRDQRCHVQ